MALPPSKSGSGQAKPPPPEGRFEQRRHARTPFDLPVSISDAVNRVDGHIELDAADVSVGGAFIRSDLLFEVGEELELAFELPDGHAVRARGRVVRVARDVGDEGAAPGMGIQFQGLADADRAAILALVSAPR